MANVRLKRYYHLKPDLSSRLGRIANVLWGQVIVAVAALAGIRFYTEILGPAEFGTSMLALGGIALFDSLGVMALNQTLLSRCGPHSDSEQRRQISVGLSWNFLKWAGPTGTLLGLGVAVALIALGYPSYWALLPALMLLYIVAETGKASLINLLVLERRYGRYSAWIGGEAVFSLLGTAAMLLAWRADAIGFLTGYILSRLICAVVFMAGFSPTHLRKVDLVHIHDEIQPALTYGMPIAMMGPLGWISSYLDRYILGGLLGTATTGAYVAVTGLVARPFGLTTTVLSNYFRPFYFQPKLIHDGAQGCFRILRGWVLASLCIGLTGTLALGFLGDRIVRFMLAADFRQGAPLMMVLFALSQTLAITTHAADNAILAIRGSRQLLRAQIFISCATLALIPVGIMLGGVVGGLIGRCLAEAIRLTVVILIAASMIRRKNGMTGVLGTALSEETA